MLIYFDEKTKGGILGKNGKAAGKRRILLLGGAETVLGITDKFSLMPEKQGLYIKNPNRRPELQIQTGHQKRP